MFCLLTFIILFAEKDDKYNKITHQFDVWHLCKNFVKRLVQVMRDSGYNYIKTKKCNIANIICGGTSYVGCNICYLSTF